jgi:hypothetical protein
MNGSSLTQDPDPRDHFAVWNQQVQLVALRSHCLISGDRPEVTDTETEEEEHRDDITGGISPQAQVILLGRPGGFDTASEASRQSIMPDMFE